MTRFFLVASCLFFPLVFGCGEGAKFSTDYVEGIVKLDGAPLAGASVSFSPNGGGKFASGKTDSSGRYTLTASQGGGKGKGTTPGDYVVLVTKVEVVHYDPPKPNPNPDDPPITSEPVNVLPRAYNDSQAAKLTAKVVAGKNKFDFDLNSKEKHVQKQVDD